MLAEALADYREHKLTAKKRCCVARWAMTLSEEDQTAFDAAVRDYKISNRALHTLFRKAGATYSSEALRRHRNEDCGCQN